MGNKTKIIPKATISLMALTMMNVTIIAGIANDVQQSFYGLSSITFFIVGALVFFLPCGLVSAEMASGWGQRGGSFRWIGEAWGKGFAFLSLAILWFQLTILFGAGISTTAGTIGFYGPDLKWGIDFAKHPTHLLLIIAGILAVYWIMAFLCTRGVKVFAKLAKYGVMIGTVIPLVIMIVLAIVWVAKGNPLYVDFTPSALVPKWKGLPTLAMAAGVFFSFAGIETNAAHIKQLKNQKEYPTSVFLSMIICVLVFVVGTVIIAMINPLKDINLLYTLAVTFYKLGGLIGMPWLYMVFMWAGLFNLIANIITNMAGPSFMLGQVARAGFLPKSFQGVNKHGMPSKLIYLQMALTTVIALLVVFLPNVEGFLILLTQAVTILYMTYYVIMFGAFLKLRYDQPNRPRSFKVPGGTIGAVLCGGIGILACLLGIGLAFIPPQQLLAQVGSPAVYVGIILGLVGFVMIGATLIYRSSLKHDWVDKDNKFSPFTWQIEGLSKPERVLSDIPSDTLALGQNPMGMPIARPYKPNEMLKDIKAPTGTSPEEIKDGEYKTLADVNTDHIVVKGAVSPASSGVISTDKVHHFYTPDELAKLNTQKS